MNEETARQILGKHFIGSEELKSLPILFQCKNVNAPDISFTADVLRERAKTHILILTPPIEDITLNGLREKFGMDPAASEPCMYNQDWYAKETFANLPLDGKWHLIRKDVLEEGRSKQPEDIEAALQGEGFPSAITVAFTFFVWWHLQKEVLWRHDFLWSQDRDHNNDRVYVGRYEDPDGVNKKGFNIHRHLSLRHSYTAAPEVIL